MSAGAYASRRAALLADPAVRRWVKERILELDRRDPCDVLADLELLGELARLRLEGPPAATAAR